MFSSFNQKSKPKTNNQEAAQKRLTASSGHRCLHLLERWAACLQHQADKLSGRFKKIALVGFCLLSGGYSLYLVINNLTNHPPKAFLIAPIKVSEQAGQTGEENLSPVVVITPAEYQELQRFRHYMDSLAGSPSGRKLHDHILKSRPGLMDSIRFIENRYQLQSSEK